MQGFDIGNDSVQVGLIEFSGSSKVVFPFNKYQTESALSAAILKTVKTDGSTNTHLALDVARDQLFKAKNGRRFE